MKKLLLVLFSVLALVSCSTTKTIEVPVEIPVIHNQYIHNTDTIIQQDSVYRYVYMQGDTIHDIEYKYKYIRHTQKDTVLVNDTIYQPKYITKTKEVQYTPWYAKILAWIGGFCLIVIFIYVLLKIKF